MYFDYKELLKYIIPKPKQSEIAYNIIKDVVVSELYQNLCQEGNDLLNYYHTMILDLKSKVKKGPIQIKNPIINYIYKFYNDLVQEFSTNTSDEQKVLSISHSLLSQKISVLSQFINDQYYQQLETDKKHLQATIEDLHIQVLHGEKEIEKKIITINSLEETIIRNIETQVNDRCYSLLYELDGLKRQIKFYDKKIKFECERVKEIEKRKYIDEIRDLKIELKSVKHEYEMFKENIDQKVKDKVAEVYLLLYSI